MFNTYTVELRNHNLITNNGYEFFLKKWYSEDEQYPIQLGYYNDNKFYRTYNINNVYNDELKTDGEYSKTLNYIDKRTYKQYRYDGENFVGFSERLYKICIGNCDSRLEPSENDTDLYSLTNEYIIDMDEFEPNSAKLVMTYETNNTELNGVTEIGVKTNHGRLVSHDIHAPYNLPFGTNISLEYIFKLK